MTFDEFTKKLGSTGEKACEMLETGTEKAALLAEIAKYDVAAARERVTLEKIYAQIGKLYCDGVQPQRLESLKQKTSDCLKNINDLQAKAQQLKKQCGGGDKPGSKNGIVVCRSCGAVNEADSGFCRVCAAKLENEL
ncbi:MAG TPA: hypothetical protein PLT66_01375 [Bacillota bacterium]|nr:hypothetical protein [Bacillota bacterium]